MKVVGQKVEILTPIDYDFILKHIESCGRISYKSEYNIKEGSAEEFIRNIIKRGHESVLEHFSFTVKFTTNRGVTHEMVRHRIASYTQESTRYCNYSSDRFNNEITVIQPSLPEKGYAIWLKGCQDAEKAYFDMLDHGCTPQEARDVLPNALKTEIVMTANIREWRHYLKLRCDKSAHPQIRELSLLLLDQLKEKMPVFFIDF